MAKNEELMEVAEVNEEVTEVKDEIVLVSNKDAIRSIGHNIKVSLTDKEAWKERGKKAIKGLAIAGAVIGGLAIADKLTRPDGNGDEEDWTDDEIIDGEATIINEGTEAETEATVTESEGDNNDN